jgi:RNA-binding protein PNO1
MSVEARQAVEMELDIDEKDLVSSQPPEFAQVNAEELTGGVQFRSVPVPANRMTPLKKHWEEIYVPIVKHMKVQVRMNTRRKSVELRTCKETADPAHVQKAADFVKAFLLGFEIKDAIALLRLDDLYMDSFDIKDGKSSTCFKVLTAV